MTKPYTLEKKLQADLAPLPRRRFLKAAVLVSAVAAAAAGGFSVLRRSEKDALAMPSDITHLSAQEYQLFKRLAEVSLPTEGTQFVPVDQVPVLKNVEYLLAGLAPEIREQLGMGLALFDNAAVITGGDWGRFVDLPDDKALVYIEKWLNSSQVVQRAVACAATRIVRTAYWMDLTAAAVIGFDGPVSRKWGMESLGNAPMPA